MNQADTEILRFKIIVIQSLKTGDYKTGEHLYDDVIKWKEIIHNDVCTQFISVVSKDEFIACIIDIQTNLEDGDVLTLQLETHGCPDGISFANDDIMHWDEFQDLMIGLNTQLGGLLVVCLAMCFGGATVSKLNLKARAPYRAIVVPFKEVPAGKVEDGFREFYSEYKNLLDLPQAILKLQEASKDENGQPYFYALTSEEIFDKTFDPDRDPDHFRKMVEYHCFRLTGGLAPENLKRIDTQIRQMLLSAKSFRDHYLFRDMYNKEDSTDDNESICTNASK